MLNTPKKLNPRQLILDLLHANGEQGLPVQSLISIGKLFGFAEASIRVTLTRLAAENYLCSPRRGYYCLGAATDAISEYLRFWRIGEGRTRPWKRRWIAILLPSKPERKDRRKTQRAAKLYGMCKARENLLVRPHNLLCSFDEFKSSIRRLGLEKDAAIFLASELDASLMESWEKQLWDVEKWANRHQKSQKRLEDSLKNLEHMPLADAVRESFLNGRQSLHILVTDPLLPEEMASPLPRISHTRTMMLYDQKARKLWQTYLRSLEAVNREVVI